MTDTNRHHYGTPFDETEVLLAVSNGDDETAERTLRAMSPGERARFARNARAAAVLADNIQEG
jgi:hypothetical protein